MRYLKLIWSQHLLLRRNNKYLQYYLNIRFSDKTIEFRSTCHDWRWRRWSSSFVKVHWMDSKINRSYTSSNTYGINIAERGSTFKSRSHFHTGAIRAHIGPVPFANTLVYICPRTSRRLIYILLSMPSIRAGLSPCFEGRSSRARTSSALTDHLLVPFIVFHFAFLSDATSLPSILNFTPPLHAECKLYYLKKMIYHLSVANLSFSWFNSFVTFAHVRYIEVRLISLCHCCNVSFAIPCNIIFYVYWCLY